MLSLAYDTLSDYVKSLSPLELFGFAVCEGAWEAVLTGGSAGLGDLFDGVALLTTAGVDAASYVGGALYNYDAYAYG